MLEHGFSVGRQRKELFRKAAPALGPETLPFSACHNHCCCLHENAPYLLGLSGKAKPAGFARVSLGRPVFFSSWLLKGSLEGLSHNLYIRGIFTQNPSLRSDQPGPGHPQKSAFPDGVFRHIHAAAGTLSPTPRPLSRLADLFIKMVSNGPLLALLRIFRYTYDYT